MYSMRYTLQIRDQYNIIKLYIPVTTRVSYRIFSGGGGGGGGGRGGREAHVAKYLIDHAHFCWNHTDLIKKRLRSRISDINLGRLMRIAIEGPQLTEVNLHQIKDIIQTTKSQNTIINLNHRIPIK